MNSIALTLCCVDQINVVLSISENVVGPVVVDAPLGLRVKKCSVKNTAAITAVAYVISLQCRCFEYNIDDVVVLVCSAVVFIVV